MSEDSMAALAAVTPVGDDLTRLRWIGRKLAGHLQQAGLTTFADIAAADPADLAFLPGINRGHLPEVVASAAAHLKQELRRERIASLRQRRGRLQQTAQCVGDTARNRFVERLHKKSGARLEQELTRLNDALNELDGHLDQRLKRAGKQLDKVERHLDLAQEHADIKSLRKQLKKARLAAQELIGHDHA